MRGGSRAEHTYAVDGDHLAGHGGVHVGRRLDGLDAAERVAGAVLGADRRQVDKHDVAQRRGGETYDGAMEVCECRISPIRGKGKRAYQ